VTNRRRLDGVGDGDNTFTLLRFPPLLPPQSFAYDENEVRFYGLINS